MSFWDGIKKFAQPFGEDEYDDYDDEAEDYREEPEEEPEAEPARRRRRSPFAATEPVTPPEATTPVTPPAASTGFGGQVINMATGKNQVVLFHAKSYDDAARAADELRKKKSIILNMENVDKALTRRVVDFLSGTVYALEGSVKKVAQSTYLFVSQNTEISGDLENVKTETENYV